MQNDDGYYWTVQIEEQFNNIFNDEVENVSIEETNASQDRASKHEASKDWSQ